MAEREDLELERRTLRKEARSAVKRAGKRCLKGNRRKRTTPSLSTRSDFARTTLRGALPALIYLQTDPLFENRRADPRFRALVQKIGIDPRL
jgi:hypothetical protein